MGRIVLRWIIEENYVKLVASFSEHGNEPFGSAEFPD
jgi:hypothetical protein